MLIYFQYSATDEYPSLVYALKTELIEVSTMKNERSKKLEEMNILKDFLALKPTE